MGEADFVSAGTTRSDLSGGAIDVTLDARIGDDALVMLRPDDVTFRIDPDGTATVVDAEFRGSTWCYTLELRSGARVRTIRSHLAHVPVGATVAPAIADGHRPVVIVDP